VLLRQTVILSWNQFVFAEGGDDEVRIAFASHDVVVKGAGLGPLLHAIALIESRAFRRVDGPSIFPARRGGLFVRSWFGRWKPSDGASTCFREAEVKRETPSLSLSA